MPALLFECGGTRHQLDTAVVRSLFPAMAVAVFFIPCSYRRVQASTPDVIYFHALGGLGKQLAAGRTAAQIRPGLRTPPALPALAPHPAVPGRNVVLILTESVRFDASCSEHAESCPGRTQGASTTAGVGGTRNRPTTVGSTALG